MDANFIYDSRAQILIDNFIHDPQNLWQVVSLRVLGQDVVDFNRPAMLLSLMLDALFWGKNPFGYHLSNVLIHTINVLRRIGYKPAADLSDLSISRPHVTLFG